MRAWKIATLGGLRAVETQLMMVQRGSSKDWNGTRGSGSDALAESWQIFALVWRKFQDNIVLTVWHGYFLVRLFRFMMKNSKGSERNQINLVRKKWWQAERLQTGKWQALLRGYHIRKTEHALHGSIEVLHPQDKILGEGSHL